MSEIEELRKKKLDELSKRYFKGRNNMVENWPSSPVHITDANIGEFVKKYDIIVVDCWAPWCGPCNMVAPIVEELAKELQGEVVFAKLNVDENQAASSKYQIMSIPTFLVFKGGNLVDKFIGALQKDDLKQRLDGYK